MSIIASWCALGLREPAPEPTQSPRRISLGALTSDAFCCERRQRDAEEPNSFSNGKQRFEQRVARRAVAATSSIRLAAPPDYRSGQ
jgi:hypothetical protein